MRERNQMEDGDLADVYYITPKPPRELVWTSEEERDAFLAEHERRTEAGESLETLDLPIRVVDGGWQ